MQIRVDVAQVRAVAAAVDVAHAEAVAVLRAPHLLRASIAGMAAAPGGAAVREAGEAFVTAWQEALEDAARELDRLSSALAAAAELYEAVEAGAANAMAGRTGFQLDAGTRPT